MTDSIAVLAPGQRVTDDNGNPISGGSLEFFSAGTTTPVTVYSDAELLTALGAIVPLDSAGYPVTGGGTRTLVYTGTDAFKIVAKNGAGVTVWSHDDVRGAADVPEGVTTAFPRTPVLSRTSGPVVIDGTNLDAYSGRLVNANPTTGSFAVSLPSAITAGDGWRIGVRHVGAANAVTVRTVGGQTISGSGYFQRPAIALNGVGHTLWFVSNGASWIAEGETPGLMAGNRPFFEVKDRLTTPPVSPTGGDRYIINGTPFGAWATLGFSAGNIVESDGNGSWIEYAALDGYLAYVEDEEILTQVRNGSWVDLSNITAPTSSQLRYAIFEHSVANGSGGGTPTASAWTTRPITTQVVNNITGASLGSNAITLPAGQYLITAQQSFYSSSTASGSDSRYEAKQRLAAGTAVIASSSVLGLSTWQGSVHTNSGLTVTTNAGAPVADTWIVSVTTGGTITLEYFVTLAFANGLGIPSAEPTGDTERYARVSVLSLTSLQGPQGAQGPQGTSGVGYGGTSTTSIEITGTGTYAWTLNSADFAYGTGSRVRVSRTSDPGTVWAEGIVTTFAASVLTVAVDLFDITGGGGPWTDWSVSIAGDSRDAFANAAAAEASELAAAASETAAAASAVAAAAAAEAAGAALFFDTKAAADAALGGLSDGDVVEVFADEDEGGARTRYRVESGVYVLKAVFDVFTQAGTGAVQRTRLAKQRERVSAWDFGAVPNLSVDSTAALQAAINYCTSTRRALHIPAGNYKISARLDVTGACTIAGDGKAGTYIWLDSATQNGFWIDTDQSVQIQDMQIVAKLNESFVSIATAGALIYVTSTTANRNSTFRNLRLFGGYYGMFIHAAEVWLVDNVHILASPFAGTGMVIRDTNFPMNGENRISNSLIQGGNAVTSWGTTGILFQSSVNLNITNSEIFGWSNGFYLNPNTSTALAHVAISNTVFSQCYNSINLAKGSTTGFTMLMLANNQIIGVNPIFSDSNTGWLTDVIINGNVIIPGDGSPLSTDSGTAITLPACEGFTITGNVIVANSPNQAYNIGANASNGRVEGNVLRGSILGGTIASPTTFHAFYGGGTYIMSNATLAATLAKIPNAADDTAAAAAGVPVGGFYRTSSTLKIRAA